MTTNQIATTEMIAAASDMIVAGFRTRGAIIEALHAAHGANIAQATDAIRAARHALPFSTRHLAA